NMLALNTSTGQTTVLEGITANTTTVTVIDGVDRDLDGIIDASDGRVFTYVATDTASNFDFNSLQDFVDGINAVFGATGLGTLTAAFNDDGSIALNRTGGTTGRVSITSTNSNFQRSLQTANMEIGTDTGTTNQFSHVATSVDLLTNLRNSDGTDLGLVSGDTITINGRLGGRIITTNQTLTVSDTSTGESFTEQVRRAFDITTGSVALDDEGKLVITGDGGTPNEIDAVNITASDGTNNRTAFNTIYDSTPNNYVETQQASDVVASASATVFDSLGQRHVMTLSFTKDSRVENRWTWEAGMKEPATVSGGSTGVITFSTDGSLASYIFDGAATSFQFEPKTGALNPVAINVNVGTLEAFDGITQLGTDTSLVANDQDGFGLGELSVVSVDNTGRIEGQFTNGRNLLLAQLQIAAFNNDSGLLRIGDNTFQQSANSGVPIVGSAGTAIKSRIVPGALEQSNVDLAQEFTNMIVAQRGFQASARIITVGDQFLTEIVNLKT
ncbi:flagellar hook-basal body complex protein, partial [candidate division KSB1 bacterium]